MGECPKGIAWWDEAFAPNAAHEPVECSNMGYCDRATAKCQCHEGFSGAACERTECPTAVAGAECSGHGTCVSMREAAAASVDALGDPSPLHYGTYYNYTNSSTWEAAAGLKGRGPTRQVDRGPTPRPGRRPLG